MPKAVENLPTFYCSLKDCPELPVRAPGKYEAGQAYLNFCGVLSTINKLDIKDESEVTPEAKLKADSLAAQKAWDCRYGK